MLYIHGEGEGDGGSCPMSGAPVSVANADQSTNECVHYYVWADDGNGHSGSFCVHCGQEESLSGEPEGQDCPVCGHWVYGDACTEEGCGWKVMRAAGEEDVTVNPQPPERPRMTMREIIDGVRTRGDLAHLSPVDAYETVHGVRPIAVSEAPATVVSMDEKKPDPFEAPATVTGPTGAISYPAEINVSGQPEPARDQWGRYLLPHPVTGLYSDGRDAAGRRNGWTRATTFAKAAADTFSLTRYDERLTLVGATLRPDVVALAHGKQVREDAKELNRLVLQVKEAAGAKVAANIGTAVHGFTEQVDAGHMAPGEVPEAYRGHVRAYLDCLADNGLEPVVGLIERTTFVDQWAGIAGTFDRVLYHRPSNTYLIGDLKTGRDLKYGRMEIAVQLALYAHGINHHGVYDWAQGRWDREMHDGRNIKVRTDFGVVMHLPIQGPETGTCSLKRINLAAGWDAAQVCGNVIASRKRDDYMEDGFVLPSAPYVPETPAVTLPESLPAITWEAAFSNVETKEEASHLWGKAKLRGVDRMELQRLVGLAQQRLRELGVLG
ncbi:MAG TPA: hypothetical protein VLG91_24100 [Streptomyces sp.]|nr:hypothetical protein [Streptomyces sp.]